MYARKFERFDPIDYTRQLRKVGVSQEQADIQAQAFEQVIMSIEEDKLTKKDFVEAMGLSRKDLEITKKDL